MPESRLDSLYRVDIRPVLVRDDSTKPTTNPKSHDHNASRQFSGNLKATTTKAPIIGLPNKINTNQHHSGYVGPGNRKQQHRGKIFPKKGARVSDPGSPKVSCFGKVLSGREKKRSRCWKTSVLEVVFLHFCGGRSKEFATAKEEYSERNILPRRRKREVVTAPAEVGPGLGRMRRFVSGRRPASWGGDVEANLDDKDVGHVVWSGPLDWS